MAVQRELVDEDDAHLVRRVRRIVRRGEPWKLGDLIAEESEKREISRGELLQLIEKTAGRLGLIDRQLEFRPAPQEGEG